MLDSRNCYNDRNLELTAKKLLEISRDSRYKSITASTTGFLDVVNNSGFTPLNLAEKVLSIINQQEEIYYINEYKQTLAHFFAATNDFNVILYFLYIREEKASLLTMKDENGNTFYDRASSDHRTALKLFTYMVNKFKSESYKKPLDMFSHMINKMSESYENYEKKQKIKEMNKIFNTYVNGNISQNQTKEFYCQSIERLRSCERQLEKWSLNLKKILETKARDGLQEEMENSKQQTISGFPNNRRF